MKGQAIVPESSPPLTEWLDICETIWEGPSNEYKNTKK